MIKRTFVMFFFLGLYACDSPPEDPHVYNSYCDRVIAVNPHHATRAFVTVKCHDGFERRTSYHWSNTVSCKENLVRVGDYIKRYGNKSYGKVQ